MLGKKLGFLRQRQRDNTTHAVEKTRRTLFGRVASLFQGARLDDELWEELEELLVDVTRKIEQEPFGNAPSIEKAIEHFYKRHDQEEDK